MTSIMCGTINNRTLLLICAATIGIAVACSIVFYRHSIVEIDLASGKVRVAEVYLFGKRQSVIETDFSQMARQLGLVEEPEKWELTSKGAVGFAKWIGRSHEHYPLSAARSRCQELVLCFKVFHMTSTEQREYVRLFLGLLKEGKPNEMDEIIRSIEKDHLKNRSREGH